MCFFLFREVTFTSQKVTSEGSLFTIPPYVFGMCYIDSGYRIIN
jgi:hypothetical protein